MTLAAAFFDRDALEALLDWYVENGVDLALDDAPHDRYAESAARTAPAPIEAVPAKNFEPSQASAPTRAPARGQPAALLFPGEAARAALEYAAAARDLEELRAAFEAFEHAPFKGMARHFLFGSGAPGARLMVMDYAPGDEEERSGEAFTGRQARLLENMLKAVGQSFDGAYLSYFSPWRPPGDKTVTPQEAAVLAPFARRHIELARPEFLLLFGEPFARALLETDETSLPLRSKWFDGAFGEAGPRARVFASLGASLKNATFKASAWRGLREVKRALDPERA